MYIKTCISQYFHLACLILITTGVHSDQDPPHTLKPIYYSIFTTSQHILVLITLLTRNSAPF